MKRRISIAVLAFMAFATVAGAQSVTTISGAQLENVPVSHLRQALSGQIAGLVIQENRSEPGYTDVSAYVRGVSSLNTAAPLVVVDGVIMQDYNIDYITPEEIESISLLKDAASTAIYGHKASGGVILINTKHGKVGKTSVRVSADYALQQSGIKPLVVSAEQYSALRKQAWQNAGSPGEFNLGAADNNWYERYVRDVAQMQRAGVSISGGTEKIRVWSNINFMNQTSLMRQETDAYKAQPRKTWVDFRAKVDVDINDWITADVQISGNIQNNRLAGAENTDAVLYNSIFNLPPTMEGPLNEDGEVTTLPNVPYPAYGLINRSGYTKLATGYLSTSAGLKFDLSSILKGLSISGRLAYQSSNDRYNHSLQTYSKYYYDFVTESYKQLGGELNTNITNSVVGTYQYSIDYIASIDWNRTFGEHNVGARAYSYFNEELTDTMEADYPSAGMPYYTHTMGVQFLYGWNDKVSAGVTLGINGSDAFARKNRYTLAPTAYASWKALDWLTVRASGGISTSDQFSTNFLRYLYLDYIKRDATYVVEGNPDLAPEMRKEVNLGLDFKLPLGFSITADVYARRLDNMLISMSGAVPSYQGTAANAHKYVNTGAMSSNGFEITLGWNERYGDWNLGAMLQWTHMSNKVLDAGEAAYPDSYKYSHRIEGYPAGQLFGYRTDGYISNEQELAEYTAKYAELGVPQLGDFKYKDLNRDGVVNSKDLAPVGKGSCPTDMASLRLNAGWKNLEIDILFNGVLGYYGSVGYNTDLEANGIYNDLHLGAWTPERAASGEKITAPALRYGTVTPSSEANDWNIENRSFLRLKNLSVSYRTGCVKWILSGQNLFTVSAMKSKVIDPETGWMTVLPVFRVFNFGVKIDF